VRSHSDANFWADVDAIFSAAVDLSPEARPALLEARCDGRPELQAEVESLLAAHDQATGFLQPAGARWPSSPLEAERPPDPASDAVDSFGPGTLVGAYRLVERIGEGGMGSVFRAERADRAFAHDVAVKITRGSLTGADAARRFRAERQILATLHHPHIVTLIDGGTLPGGEAYLVMELVDGVPITRGCRERPASLEERLRLFRQVCSAVHYAHRHAIVHRDLKPANILVTPEGLPKVLDFGVAKLLAPSPESESHTITGAFPGPLTPNYASPEQLRGMPVTTACDVYALGVLLYELITGQRPYDTFGQPLDRVLELVVHTMPARPSATGGSSDVPLPYERRRLRGDLDAIVLKALEKEPERRYASAEELADDVGRFLGGKPVVAREPSAGYVLRKLAARHKGVVAVGALAIVGVLASLGVALWQQRVAERERAHAQRRFTEVRQIANALMFKIHDAVQPLPGSTPVRRVIVEEALTYLERLSADAAADDGLRVELARGYHRVGTVQGVPNVANLGDRSGALTSLRKSVGLLTPVVGRADPPRDAALDLGRILLTLSNLARPMGHTDEALSAVRQSIKIARGLVSRNPADDDARRLLGSGHFQMALSVGGIESSVPHWERAGAIFESLLAEKPDDPDRLRNVALVQKYLGGHYLRERDPARAQVFHGRALELDERRVAAQPSNLGAELDLAISLASVASGHVHFGELAKAVGGFERSRDIRRRLVEKDPTNDYGRGRLAWVLAQLCARYNQLARRPEALAHGREAVQIAESRAGVDSQNRLELADYLATLARTEHGAGQRESACRHARRASDIARTLDLKPATDVEHQRITNTISTTTARCAGS
jgi:tetratricopeptide (TPR) repeat protein